MAEDDEHEKDDHRNRYFTDFSLTNPAIGIIKTADWLIDLGPEGGSGGGQIIATGTPEEVAVNGQSHTGRFLAPLLKSSNEKALKKPGSKAA